MRKVLLLPFAAFAVFLSGNINAATLSQTDKCSSIVETKSGFVSGRRLQLLGTNILAFLGIPYAEPPLENNRFRKPKPKKPWLNVLNATEIQPGCAAMMTHITAPAPWVSSRIILNEDCLHLNIWTPCATSGLKPVMIFLYGGQFYVGSANVKYYDGQVLAAFGDVIVVSFDYRLGVFGFLSAGIEDVPGNMGLYDQVMALRWVKDNIQAFGGDPDQITLFGHSSGADAIGYHMVSPLTQNLFQRAILQSGSLLEPSLLDDPRNLLKRGNFIASEVGCADWKNNTLYDHPEDVISCLREKSVRVLLEAQENLIDEMHVPLMPRFGDEFLPVHPHLALMEGKTGQPKQILMGTVRDEGSAILSYFRPSLLDDDSPQITRSEAETLVMSSFSFLPRQIAKLIVNEYLEQVNSNNSLDLLKSVYESLGDSLILCPCILSATAISENDGGDSVYMYLFNYRPIKTVWKAKWTGVTHFDEVPFVFGIPFVRGNDYTAEESEFSARIMETWLHFAKTGQTLRQKGEPWPSYTQSDPVYMELFPRGATLSRDVGAKRCQFWKFIFDNALLQFY